MILLALAWTTAVSPSPTIVLKPRLDKPRQVISNFAASDSWTVEGIGHWPEDKKNEIARLLFDQKTGIGLSSWRFNLGGGIDHETISVPFRTVDTFDAGEGQYDWTRVPGQRWMLEAARRFGVGQFVAYSVTPPRRLTRNGHTNGRDGDGTSNLQPGQEAAFSRYLAGIVGHLRSEGYNVTHLSPVNEPDLEWNGQPHRGTQEGCRYSNDDILRLGHDLSEELKKKKLPVKLVLPEASSPSIGFEANEGMSKKYGAAYGAYVKAFAQDLKWWKQVEPVYAYHSYWGDSLGDMVRVRKSLRQALDALPGTEAWMTEYCQMQGPRGEGGWGRDLGMTLALNVARLIHLDMTVVETTAWQWWLAVSDQDYKDGLIYVDDVHQKTGDIYPSKTLWALGNFSRFVRPGYHRVEVEGAPEDVNGLLVSSYADAKSQKLVVVCVNMSTSGQPIELKLDGRWSSEAWITSDRYGQSLARTQLDATNKVTTVPSRSVVTFVLETR